ncbi:ferritin-like domain-containing protein [Bremerella cremea]|uniref:ferritin-like domain-containing protein n=1 Tax=Bremerella cremea TaxID=1031537 RepID=UPI0031EA0821
MFTAMTDVPLPLMLTRFELATLLNEDLSREYSAIIAGVAFSKVFHAIPYRDVGTELAYQAAEDLKHAIELASQIDFWGIAPTVKVSAHSSTTNREEMLRHRQKAKTESVQRYRERVSQCEELGEEALADHLIDILLQEEQHLAILTNAIGISESTIGASKQRGIAPLQNPRLD